MTNESTVITGAKLPNLCCPGFSAEITVIFPDPEVDSVYWSCENPDCPVTHMGYQGMDSDMYSYVVAWAANDAKVPLQEWLLTPEEAIL